MIIFMTMCVSHTASHICRQRVQKSGSRSAAHLKFHVPLYDRILRDPLHMGQIHDIPVIALREMVRKQRLLRALHCPPQLDRSTLSVVVEEE